MENKDKLECLLLTLTLTLYLHASTSTSLYPVSSIAQFSKFVRDYSAVVRFLIDSKWIQVELDIPILLEKGREHEHDHEHEQETILKLMLMFKHHKNIIICLKMSVDH